MSFLFRSVNADGKPIGWHRWNSDRGFTIGSGWQHIAVSYTFGDAKSMRGYLNGEPVTGTWDNDGPTDRGPVADDGEVWIGSALGGSANNSFVGGIDEVAIHRTAMNPEQMARRYARRGALVPHEQRDPPEGQVLAEIVEFLPDKWTWDHPFGSPTEHFVEKSFAMVDLVQRYNREALRVDRSNPMLLRMTADVVIPEGEQQLLVRSRGGARLFVDDKLLLTTPFPRPASDGHYKLYSSHAEASPNMAGLWPGDRQAIAPMVGNGKKRRLRLEVFVGGRRTRPEVGNLLVAIAPPGEDFQIVSPADEKITLTDVGWAEFADRYRTELVVRNAERRREADTAGTARWAKRHELARDVARQLAEAAVPQVKNAAAVNNEIDRLYRRQVGRGQPFTRADC